MEINVEAYHKQQEECVICLDDIETEWRELECHHRYHKQCIENWIVVRATCPLCMKYNKGHRREKYSGDRSYFDSKIDTICSCYRGYHYRNCDIYFIVYRFNKLLHVFFLSSYHDIKKIR